MQDIFAKLWKNGYIYEDETIQPFCPVETHNTFLADRFVEGECSICGDKGARGDQCDVCGAILDPLKPEEKETPAGEEASNEVKATGWLVNPRCKVDGTTPEARKTKHLYLKLDDIAEQLKGWYKTTADNGWSANAKSITQSWIDKGLKPRAISRDLKWGVPIPAVDGLNVEDYARKVFYVWFDACIGYISITKTYTDGENRDGKNWEKWWKNPENVKLMQFQGKDNVGFHSIVFPSSLLGTKENWTKVHRISATEYLNYENGKFSKSRGIGVFGNNAKDTGIDPDIWRFYLLSRRPELADSEFKWEEFIDVNNNELLKNIGNFIQRTLKFCVAKMESTVPPATFSNEEIEAHKVAANQILATYIEHQEANKMRGGILDILALSALGNKFLQDNGLNNKLLAEEPDRCNAVINVALNHVHLLAGLLYPYMPTTAEAIFKQLGEEPKAFIPDTFDFKALEAGHKIGTPEPLFSVIPAAKLDEWRDAYGGEELKKLKALEAEKAAAKKAKKLADKEKKKAKKAEAAGDKKSEAGASASDAADVSKLSLEEKK